jgi:hypothetical protein
MPIESYWENVSGAKLRQGDYIFNCPVPVFAEQFPERQNEIEIAVDIEFYDLIVVTQSCDLEQNKIRLVAMCPIYSLENYEAINVEFVRKGRWEEVRKGRIEGLYLLSSTTNPENNRECLVVDFREIYSLPFEFLTKHADSLESRRRLKSPYLEHFSQAFARFFMRVGLPANIPPFK